jgi:hypothetical protein
MQDLCGEFHPSLGEAQHFMVVKKTTALEEPSFSGAVGSACFITFMILSISIGGICNQQPALISPSAYFSQIPMTLNYSMVMIVHASSVHDARRAPVGALAHFGTSPAMQLIGLRVKLWT